MTDVDTTQEYPDLPDWIRPGAKLANLTYRDGYLMVTVQRITRTQIVAAADTNPDNVNRYRRVPEPPRRYDQNEEPRYTLLGSYGSRLVPRNHPDVVRLCIDAAAKRAADEVAETRKRYGNPAKGDERPTEERALTMLDDIENAARTARRTILRLIASTSTADTDQTDPRD